MRLFNWEPDGKMDHLADVAPHQIWVVPAPETWPSAAQIHIRIPEEPRALNRVNVLVIDLEHADLALLHKQLGILLGVK